MRANERTMNGRCDGARGEEIGRCRPQVTHAGAIAQGAGGVLAPKMPRLRVWSRASRQSAPT